MSYTTEETKNENIEEAHIKELENRFKLKTGLDIVNISIKHKTIFVQTNKRGMLWGYAVSFKNWYHIDNYYNKFSSDIYNFFKNNCINGEESLLILSQFLDDINKEFC